MQKVPSKEKRKDSGKGKDKVCGLMNKTFHVYSLDKY